jgi:hypothetical protein
MDGELGRGIVECAARRPLSLPYVQVPDVVEGTRTLAGSTLPSYSSRGGAGGPARLRGRTRRQQADLLAAEANRRPPLGSLCGGGCCTRRHRSSG